MTNIPHLAFPMRMAGRNVAVNEQDSYEEVRDCVNLIIRTDLGARITMPEMGTVDPTFNDFRVIAGQIEDTVAQFEPRADIDIEDRTDYELRPYDVVAIVNVRRI